MRALTWNLWGRGGDWRRRHDAIAAVIAESARAHPPRPQDGVAIGNAVLTRWPIVAGEELELPTRGLAERRVAVRPGFGAGRCAAVRHHALDVPARRFGDPA